MTNQHVTQLRLKLTRNISLKKTRYIVLTSRDHFPELQRVAYRQEIVSFTSHEITMLQCYYQVLKKQRTAHLTTCNVPVRTTTRTDPRYRACRSKNMLHLELTLTNQLQKYI